MDTITIPKKTHRIIRGEVIDVIREVLSDSDIGLDLTPMFSRRLKKSLKEKKQEKLLLSQTCLLNMAYDLFVWTIGGLILPIQERRISKNETLLSDCAYWKSSSGLRRIFKISLLSL